MTRYAPSKKKVVTYLSKKNVWNIEEVLIETGYNEDIMCDMWLRSFMAIGIWKRDIFQKLYKKEFPVDMIEKKLEYNDDQITDWDLHKQVIINQMSILLERWKSVKVVTYTFVAKYPYFRNHIMDYLENYDDLSWLKKDIDKYKKKYNCNIPAQQQKLIQALLRKGFEYSKIREVLKVQESAE